MKTTLHILALLIVTFGWSQVGIGTNNPQETLHIAGTTSTIRIEGLDALNNPQNLGSSELTPVYVDYKGNLTLTKPTYTVNGNGYDLPLEFKAFSSDFVPNNPLGLPAPFDRYGTVINSDVSNTENSDIITTQTIEVTNQAMIEVKYSMSLYFSSTDLASPPMTPIIDSKSIAVQVYYCVDINSDGLSSAELAIKYGSKGQYYASTTGGTRGYPYMNSQGYMNLPEGNHTIYFFGVVKDPINTFTSIGFGGANDYLKIRVYN